MDNMNTATANLSEAEKLTVIARRFGAALATFVDDHNAAGWVIDTIADPATGAAFIATRPELSILCAERRAA